MGSSDVCCFQQQDDSHISFHSTLLIGDAIIMSAHVYTTIYIASNNFQLVLIKFRLVSLLMMVDLQGYNVPGLHNRQSFCQGGLSGVTLDFESLDLCQTSGIIRGGKGPLQQQKIHTFRELLTQLAPSSSPYCYVHKIQIRTRINKEHYGELSLTTKGNSKAKYHTERINHAQGPPDLEYNIYPNGTVMVFISCSGKPFRLARKTTFLPLAPTWARWKTG